MVLEINLEEQESKTDPQRVRVLAPYVELLSDSQKISDVDFNIIFWRAQHQAFRSSMRFKDAVDSANSYIRHKAFDPSTKRTRGTTPARLEQVQGVLASFKIQEFVETVVHAIRELEMKPSELTQLLSRNSMVFDGCEEMSFLGFRPLISLRMKAPESFWDSLDQGEFTGLDLYSDIRRQVTEDSSYENDFNDIPF